MLGSILGSIASTVGGLFGANKDAKNQKLFAQKGLQWRVADGLAAGVHPLAAIGFNGPSYSPTYANVGAPLESMGQNIDRAVAAKMEAPDRAAVGLANKLQLENQALQNKLLEAQIGDIHRGWLKPQAGSPPAMPGNAGQLINGQNDTTVVTQPTLYEAFEKLFGDAADGYGGAEMARQGTTKQNWPVVKAYLGQVLDQVTGRAMDEFWGGMGPLAPSRTSTKWKWSNRRGMGRYGAASPR